jgi:flagellar FliL protein
MSDAPAAGDAHAEGAKTGPNKMIVIGALVGGLLAGVGAGMFVLGPKLAPPPTAEELAAAEGPEDGKKEKKGKKDKHPKEEKKAEGEHGKEGEAAALPVMKLDNLIVNPAGSDGARFLMASVAIELETAEEAALLKGKEIELRDGVTSLLASQSLQQLSAPDARAQLKVKIAAAVKPLLEDEEAEPKVWIPQFVIQ